MKMFLRDRIDPLYLGMMKIALFLIGVFIFVIQENAYSLNITSTAGRDMNIIRDIRYFACEKPLQKLKVAGVITDKTTGESIPGVNIAVKGTTIGTISDPTGNYFIEVPDGNAILVFSFMGYLTQEISVDNRAQINVFLEQEVKSLDEIVVVGYGTQKKESVVGAITQLNSEALMKSSVSTVTNALSGKLSGVLTIQNTGEPGNDQSEIIIRGLSSWNGSQPLVLVDGVERDFNTMDNNEISSISVLKDASATAVFGAKGANGVIIVTTKRGKLSKPKLDFAVASGFEKATRIPDHISSYTTMQLLNVAYMNNSQFTSLTPQNILEEYRNPSTPLNRLRYPDVNWFDELTKPFANTTTCNFNITGGTNFVKYFTSLGYLYQGDFFKSYHSGYDDTRYYYHRFNYRANVDFDLTSTSKLSFNIGGQAGISSAPSSSPWRNLYSTSPGRYPAYFPDWVLQQVPDPDYPDASGKRLAANFGEYTGNPYTSLNQGSFNRDFESKLFTDLSFNQSLDAILKGLSFRGMVSLSTYYENRSLTASYSFPDYILNYDLIGVAGRNPWYRSGEGNEVYKLGPLDINVGGLNDGYYINMNYELSMNYNKSFGHHNITALALVNRQQKNDGISFPYYNEGLVGRTTYDYKNKYLLELNIGYTGSERFAPENRFGFFPSAAVGWVISEEDFFKRNIEFVSQLKIRYSDGLVGSDKASNRWLYISEYFLDNIGYIHEDKGANRQSQWEEARKKDIGLELALFKDKFTLNVDFFDEYRSHMLLAPRSVTMMVGNTFKELNIGKMKKHGFEMETEYRDNIGKNFSYFVRGIFGFNENRILFKDDPPYSPDYLKEAGKPIGAQLNGAVLSGTGYYTSVDDIHNNPSPIDLTKLVMGDYKFLDYNADGKISNFDKYPVEGNTYPPITYSFSAGIEYKGFDFHFQFQGNRGKYVEYNQTYEVEFIKGDWRVHSSQLDYWTPTNPNANHSTLHYSGSSSADILIWGGGEADRGYQLMIPGRYWRNADYLRIKEIFLGYTFGSDLMKRFRGIGAIKIYATGFNLYTFTKLIEGDPERKDFQQGFYPQMASVKMGVQVSF